MCLIHEKQLIKYLQPDHPPIDIINKDKGKEKPKNNERENANKQKISKTHAVGTGLYPSFIFLFGVIFYRTRSF